MIFTFLGTGTSQGVPVIGCRCEVCTSSDPRDVRLRTSGLVEYEDATILIDAGPDLRQQMLAHSVNHIDAVLITHEHNDHLIGLDDLRPFIFQSAERLLKIYALPRVLDEIRTRFAYAFMDHPYPGAPRFELIPITFGFDFHIKGHKITPVKVMHGILEIAGFVFPEITYITDCRYLDEEVCESIKGMNRLVLNALRKEEHHSHLNLDQAIQLAQKLEAKETYLTHVSHKMGCTLEWTKGLSDNIIAAYDGLKL